MASLYEGPVQRLIDELGRLPGIGPKSAQRIAFYHLAHRARGRAPARRRRSSRSKEKISWCRRCFNIAEGELCQFCLDDRRDRTVLCVVEEPRDIVAVERTQEFRGSYHVLQGTISPIEGIGPEQLRIKELLARVRDDAVAEVILATNPNTDGEVTAMYLARALGRQPTCGSRGSPAVCPSAATSSTPTRSPSGRALEGRRRRRRLSQVPEWHRLR